MITLALSQVLWGLAYRLVSVTNGDNGISGHDPTNALRRVAGDGAQNFYWFALAIAVIAFRRHGDLRVLGARRIAQGLRATSLGA